MGGGEVVLAFPIVFCVGLCQRLFGSQIKYNTPHYFDLVVIAGHELQKVGLIYPPENHILLCRGHFFTIGAISFNYLIRGAEKAIWTVFVLNRLTAGSLTHAVAAQDGSSILKRNH